MIFGDIAAELCEFPGGVPQVFVHDKFEGFERVAFRRIFIDDSCDPAVESLCVHQVGVGVDAETLCPVSQVRFPDEIVREPIAHGLSVHEDDLFLERLPLRDPQASGKLICHRVEIGR